MNVRRNITVLVTATALTAGLAAIGFPASAADCSVRSDGRLYCDHKAGAKGYEQRSYQSLTKGQLDGTFDWFQCWGHGDRHAGANDIWYWTQLDNGAWGNVPAYDVSSPVDPAPGLREC